MVNNLEFQNPPIQDPIKFVVPNQMFFDPLAGLRAHFEIRCSMSRCSVKKTKGSLVKRM